MSKLSAVFRIAAISAAFFCASVAAQASEKFDVAKFAQAQAEGRSVLVEISADWCPVCVQQKPIVHALETEFPKLTVFDVDFDTAKDITGMFKAPYQSTLIMFKGRTETGRSTGQTDPAAIKALVLGGL